MARLAREHLPGGDALRVHVQVCELIALHSRACDERRELQCAHGGLTRPDHAGRPEL